MQPPSPPRMHPQIRTPIRKPDGLMVLWSYGLKRSKVRGRAAVYPAAPAAS